MKHCSLLFVFVFAGCQSAQHPNSATVKPTYFALGEDKNGVVTMDRVTHVSQDFNRRTVFRTDCDITEIRYNPSAVIETTSTPNDGERTVVLEQKGTAVVNCLVPTK